MAGQNWNVNIVAGSPLATFVPDVYSETNDLPGQLKAQLNDLVSWNNQTADPHRIWLTDENYQPQRVLTDTIEPGESSSPGYVPLQADGSPATPTPPLTIYYYCSEHTDERGTILVVA